MKNNIRKYLEGFVFENSKTKTDVVEINGEEILRFTNEYWTSKQRQANSLHEVSYRACFKPQLPKFFIEWLTEKEDIVYDPFSGRGTTVLEAALLGRNIIANDVNPLSRILSEPRLFIPDLKKLDARLNEIEFDSKAKSEIDLTMFYHPKTEAEIVSLKNYLKQKQENKKEDEHDLWIRMVATNRLTGHSKNFFSVYTLPPNQAISAEKQKRINRERNQKPEYKNVREIILKKTNDLLKEVDEQTAQTLRNVSLQAKFHNSNAAETSAIKDNSVQLSVTSPPFLDVVQYAADNWLRCWFNDIDAKEIAEHITMSKSVEEWNKVMSKVFSELYRITRSGGFVAFEVGEVRGGKIKLDEVVVPLGKNAGFNCEGILVNQQAFTKTANIWGVHNNRKGTNTNRIVLFSKE